jgi:hypothetical protein
LTILVAALSVVDVARGKDTVLGRWAKPTPAALSDGTTLVVFTPSDQQSPEVRIGFRVAEDRTVIHFVSFQDVVHRPGGLGSEDIRVPLGQLAAIGAQTIADMTPDEWWGDPKAVETIKRALSKEASAAPRHVGARSRPRLPKAHYRRIAVVYLQHLHSGLTRGILQRIAADEGVSVATARDWVRRARELKFLSPGRQGTAGATPGERLGLAELAEAGHVRSIRTTATSPKGSR